MAFDEGLAERIREILADTNTPHVSEKRMFGGLAFLVSGNMSVGIVKDELIARTHPDQFATLCLLPHARAMDFTGKKMKGWITVSQQGLESEEALQEWISRSLSYVTTLPSKTTLDV